MSKKCTPLWREAHFHVSFGPLLEVAMSKKCTPLWREGHFEVNAHVRATFGRSDVVSHGRRKGMWTLSTVGKNLRVLWHFQKRWQAWDIWRGPAKMHFPWQAQYKRHFHQSCYEVRALISWEGVEMRPQIFKICRDDFAWQVQHFVRHGITFSWQAQ